MNTILWMADEIIAQTHPKDWEAMSQLSHELFSTIGNPNLKHEIVMPQACIGELAQQLLPHKFSVAIDLTGGWLGESLRPVMSATPIINDFHLSRVRDVSDPSLGTTGHLLSLSPNQISHLKKEFDFSRPLILDDVSFSGLSSKVTIEQFGLDPKKTVNGFLILNEGELGPNPGARTSLEHMGSRAIGGRLMNTSLGDDGWHIKDFIEQPNLAKILGTALLVQELFEIDGKESEFAKRLFTNEALRKVCFPKARNLNDLKKLSETDQFIFNQAHKAREGSIHTTNPTLLISPAVLEHISSKKFRDNFDHVSETMLAMQHLSFDQEASLEAIRGLRETVNHNIEGMFMHPERNL